MQDDTTKSGAIARAAIAKSTRSRFFGDFTAARKVLRSSSVVQGGVGIQTLRDVDEDDVTMFYLDGKAHQKRRAAIAPFFTLKTITEKYEPVMHRCADTLISRLAQTGAADLGELAFYYAVVVAADVIGLDYSDIDWLARQIGSIIDEDGGKRPTKDFDDPDLLAFFDDVVQPAIDRRRKEPTEDIISTMIANGHKDRFIRTEVRGYAIAGMATTREFISMAAWYLFEQPNLMERFRTGSDKDQFAILDEVIRLEPVSGVIKREASEPMEVAELGPVAQGDILGIDIRKANLSEDVVGECPYAFNPDRENRIPAKSGYMSFGDGPHRCPGAMLSIHETRIFLDKLARLPELKLVSEPQLSWFRPITSYEIKNMLVTCEKVG
ncbi:MAG: cytochrome P450 [Sphingomonadaceae bacterium]|nr:cytochrome P450 [Sphingomonadaceae bacterium]